MNQKSTKPDNQLQSNLIAHDLNSNIWRSEDVNVFEYLKHGEKLEIKTSFQNDFLSKDFLLKLASESTTFSLMKIDEVIVDDLKRCGFIWPSPIQSICIPIGRLGIDLIAQSKSGTGKTMVFVVCALEMIIQDYKSKTNDVPCPKVLILAPTREIAVQIADIIDSLTINWKHFSSGSSCYKAIGGIKVSENISKLYESMVIVGTPGRILSLLENDFLKPQTIRLFILDECDKLMDDKFQIQIDKIYNYLPVNKQMIVTSATMSTEMTDYLRRYMRDPVQIRLNADELSLIGVMQYMLKVDGHCLDYLNFESKMDSLLEILRTVHFNQCFIFVNYQTRVQYVYNRLKVDCDFGTTFITGDMSQKERLQTIDSFRKQHFKIIVSTDLTSRGIDIESVNLVINIDVPIDYETYLHRIGRSGRYGSSGIAITIVGHNEDYEKFCSNIAQHCDYPIKELHLPLTMNLWDLFYNQDDSGTNLETQSTNDSWTKLRVEPFFEQLYLKLNAFENIEKSNLISEKKKSSLKNLEELKTILTNIILPPSPSRPSSINHKKDNGNFNDDEEKENKIKSPQSPQTAERALSFIVKRESIQHPSPPSLTMEQMFSKMFLNPCQPSTSSFVHHFRKDQKDNNIVWRYLLNGSR